MDPLTAIGTVLGAAALYVVARWQDGKPILKRTPTPEEAPPPWAQHLLDYYNHDTTEHMESTARTLDELKRGQNEVKDIMREHNKLDERIIVLLEAQEKYGVKIRKE